jgi:hypothetical protein
VEQEPTIGVALSGGGHRAALFGLGVLMYLHDAGKHAHVNSISSVSGGSLTNAYVGQECCFRTSSDDQFSKIASRLAKTIAQEGTLFNSLWTWAYIVLLIISLVACCLLLGVDPHWLGGLLFLAALVVWEQYVLGARGAVCARAFGATLFHSKGQRTTLQCLAHDALDHVLCATELHSGEHLYFSGRFVYSFRLGRGDPSSMKLEDAVQASAAFPGGFPPRWFRTAPFNFKDGRMHPNVMVVSDGGVYDNMAEQWIVGARSRAERDGVPQYQQSDTLLLVNASSPIEWLPTSKMALPLIGEVISFLRVIDVLYDNTTAQRRQALVDRFKTKMGMQGTLVTIDQTPLTVARGVLKDGPDERTATRANAVLARFEPAEANWNAVRETSRNVRTTLRAIGNDNSANLLYHAYAVANANLHVIMGYPLLDTPDQAIFEQLLQI